MTAISSLLVTGRTAKLIETATHRSPEIILSGQALIGGINGISAYQAAQKHHWGDAAKAGAIAGTLAVLEIPPLMTILARHP